MVIKVEKKIGRRMIVRGPDTKTGGCYMGETPQEQSTVSGGGLNPNVAVLLAYLLWIPAILWLVMDPYKKDPFIRFHSLQALFLGLAWFALSIALTVLPTLVWLLLLTLPFAAIAVVIVCAYKAYKNEWFKIPVIGDLAEKQAGTAQATRPGGSSEDHQP